MKSLSIVFFVVILLCASAGAQTTTFSYQGSLKDGATAANGNYDFQFALYDAVSGGTQTGSTLTVQTATTNYGFTHTDGTVIVGSFVGGSTGGGYYGTKSNPSLSFFTNNGAPSLTIDTNGLVNFPVLASAGGAALCRNGPAIAFCSSSLRYKKNIRVFD